MRGLLNDHDHRRGLIGIFRQMNNTLVVFVNFVVTVIVTMPKFAPTGLVNTLNVNSITVNFTFGSVFRGLLSNVLLLVSRPFHVNSRVISKRCRKAIRSVGVHTAAVGACSNQRIIVPGSSLCASTLAIGATCGRHHLRITINVNCRSSVRTTGTRVLQTLSGISDISAGTGPDIVTANFNNSSVSLVIH